MLVKLLVLLTLFTYINAQEECVTKMDLFFVLDHSCSIDDKAWVQVESFAASIVQSFDVGPNSSRFGAVQFAGTSSTRVEFPLLDDKSTIISKVKNISRIGCGTDIAKGIQLARKQLEENTRPDATPVILLMTDGVQSVTGDPAMEADIAKAENMDIYVIGVGKMVNPDKLKLISSQPLDKYLFFVDNFGSLVDILKAVINNTCVHVYCPNISPNYGPAEGGTLVTITGEGFINSGYISCRFGNTVVPGIYINETQIQCKSPPGAMGTVVALEISVDGISWTSDHCQFTYSKFKPDPCAQWSQNCSYCISHPFCGWCSTPVLHPDGTTGAQCAGFNHQNNTDEEPFICVGIYHTEECIPGYLCNEDNATCTITEPGNGDTLENCQVLCGVGQIYNCTTDSNNNSVCLMCQPGTLGCVSHTDCFKRCNLGPLPPDTPPEDGPPGDLQNTIWRGLTIHSQYPVGEWQMKFGNITAQILDPNGVLTTFTVQHTTNEIWFTFKDGPSAGNTMRAIYALEFVGQVVEMTLANGAVGQSAPVNFDQAMTNNTSSGMSEFVWVKCLNPATCSFHWDGPTKKRAIFSEKRTPMQVVDYCANFTDCDSCVEQITCGWCNYPVIYKDGSLGKNCAGYNPDSSKNPFICRGIFATDTCTHVLPPQSWNCNEDSNTCEEGPEGSGTDYITCNATCGRVLPPPSPITPPELQGVWRGFQIQNGYPSGEFRATFSSTAVIVEDPTGVIILTGNVYSVEDQVWIQTSTGDFVKGIWQLGYGEETKHIGWAYGLPGGPIPKDFGYAMVNSGFTEYFFAACLDQKISSGNCLFDH